jgi:hypothetical protein
MKHLFFSLWALLTVPAYADIFKCQLESGKTVYQPTPCQSAVKQQTIEIEKTDPRKTAEAEAKLKAWKEDFAIREEARINAEKEQQAERDRRASVEALEKSAEYQQQQAIEAKRQADALEQRNFLSPQIFQLYPYYPNYQPQAHPQHNHFTDPRRPGQIELKSGISTDNGGANIFINVK